MNNKKIEVELISATALEINDRLKLILKIFPKDKDTEFLLKNMAAASIHVALFLKDLNYYVHGDKIEINKELENDFLNECGCKNK